MRMLLAHADDVHRLLQVIVELAIHNLPLGCVAAVVAVGEDCFCGVANPFTQRVEGVLEQDDRTKSCVDILLGNNTRHGKDPVSEKIKRRK